MAGILVVGEVAPDGSLTKLSTEAATLARLLHQAGAGEPVGIVHGKNAEGAAAELGLFVATVHVDDSVAADSTVAPIAVALAAIIDDYDLVLLPASPDGRDLAGTLSALSGWGVLANATGVSWSDDGPLVEQSVFGGKLITESAFTDRRGIITVRPNAVTAQPLVEAPPDTRRAAPTTAHRAAPTAAQPTQPLPEVRVVDRIEQAGAAASIDDARIIVAGGRGVGGPDGFGLVQQLAAALGGAVGATRAAVDSGWIGYSQQIGQTGKIVKPELYLALGISGAIQHKVGMQTAGTIVAVNRDPDAPIAEFADLVVVGDLVEVGNALLDQLRARSD